MTVAARLGNAVRSVGRTPLGRRIGTSLYYAAARAAAARLSRIPRVSGVYLMGALARGESVDPGYSDIDLVVACEFPSIEGEVATMTALAERQETVSAFGGLFYNLDCFDVREVPFARAFGGAWEMRFDGEAVCLAGETLWNRRLRRSNTAVRREQLSYALRRWVNTGARLLDPRIAADDGIVWDAQRLVVDVAALWGGNLTAPNSRGLLDSFPTETGSAVSELRTRGVEACGAGEVRSLLLPATLEILDAFAEEVTSEYQHAISVIPDERPFSAHAELPVLAHALLGAPFESVVLLHRGPAPGGYIPVAVAAEATNPRDTVRAFAARLADARGALSGLEGWCRRPLPLSRKLWGALAAVEPAPFVAASAAHPRWCVGVLPSAPRVPDPPALEDMLRSTAVQSFSLCRAMDLRPGKVREHRLAVTWDRFALLPGLERALDERVFETDFRAVSESSVQSLPNRVRMLREFSERRRAELTPVLEARLRR